MPILPDHSNLPVSFCSRARAEFLANTSIDAQIAIGRWIQLQRIVELVCNYVFLTGLLRFDQPSSFLRVLPVFCLQTENYKARELQLQDGQISSHVVPPCFPSAWQGSHKLHRRSVQYRKVDKIYVFYAAYSICMSGALVSPNKLPVYIRWLTFLSVGLWSISGTMLVQFKQGSLFDVADICSSLQSCSCSRLHTHWNLEYFELERYDERERVSNE